MKKMLHLFFPHKDKEKKWMRVMKLTTVILLVTFMQVSANVFSQGNKVTIKEKNISLERLLWKLQSETDFVFVFSQQHVDDFINLEVNVSGALEDILDEILSDKGLVYEKKNEAFIIKKAPTQSEFQQPERIVITGQVLDDNGEPIPGANIYAKDGSSGGITDANGNFVLGLRPGTDVFVVSFIGMVTQEIEIGSQRQFKVKMQSDVSELGDVVVNGYYVTKKESFTGTATIVEGEELIDMGTQNIMKSLSLMDPSLNLLDNNEFGSDPNRMPEIRLRGEAVFETPGVDGIERSQLQGDPNAPLFILDDFQTTIEKVMDLDMNRVASVTILKDASATAIYGSRAANGVIVIRTKQPVEGKLQISYNLNTDFSFPDLDEYDLLNAEELFGLQKDLNLYNFVSKDVAKALEIERLIASGVDTDWLAQPTRNAVGQKHSLNLMGGDKHMRYMFDLNYADRPGVMKGSDRENFGIANTLQYNMNDKIIFRNKLEVDKNSAADSPYGSFDYYATMPSYFPIHDANGNLMPQYSFKTAYGEDAYFHNYNPIYEAQVGNSSTSSYTTIINNFSVEWNMHLNWRLRANISYTNSTRESEVFNSPYSQQYWSTNDPTERGRFSYTNTKEERFDGSTTLNFNKDFNGHFVSANVGFNISNTTGRTYGFTARGFTTNEPDPAFAKGYEEGGLPTSQEAKSRLAGLLANANYTYKNRYLFDASFRLDGSSQFGSEDKTAPFFSVGAGWNLHNESFLRDSRAISLLKLRATYGETGSVNFAPYQAQTILNYFTDSRYWGHQGTYIRM